MNDTRTCYAVWRTMDDHATALFRTLEQARAYADHLNQTVPFAVAFTSGAHLWAAHPWTAPADIFTPEG